MCIKLLYISFERISNIIPATMRVLPSCKSAERVDYGLPDCREFPSQLSAFNRWLLGYNASVVMHVRYIYIYKCSGLLTENKVCILLKNYKYSHSFSITTDIQSSIQEVREPHRSPDKQYLTVQLSGIYICQTA